MYAYFVMYTYQLSLLHIQHHILYLKIMGIENIVVWEKLISKNFSSMISTDEN